MENASVRCLCLALGCVVLLGGVVAVVVLAGSGRYNTSHFHKTANAMDSIPHEWSALGFVKFCENTAIQY